MEPGSTPNQRPDADHPTADEIDDKYSEVDPEDVTENAIDYFRGQPETESEKAEHEQAERGHAGSGAAEDREGRR